MDFEAESVNFEISSPLPSDAAGIGRVVYDAWVDTYPNEEMGISVDLVKTWVAGHLSPEGISKRATRYQEPRDPDVFNLVAKLDGEIVGMAIGNRSEEEGQWIGSIYVHPRIHGRGVGTNLMNALFEWFDLDRPIWLRVATYNLRTIRFYERFGFVVGELVAPPPTTQNSNAISIPQMNMVREPFPS